MSYKGSSWKEHKYTKKVNGIYYYNLDDQIGKRKDKLENKIEEDKLELDSRIAEAKENIDYYMDKVVDKIRSIEPPIGDTKITTETIRDGIKALGNVTDEIKDVVYMTRDVISKGFKIYTDVINKIF